MHTEIANTGITIGAVIALLGGGVGVSIIAEVIKKVFKLNSGKVVQFLVVALSTVAAGLAYVINAIHGNPAIAAGHAAAILGIANAAYTFIVSDLSKTLSQVSVSVNKPTTATPEVVAPITEDTPTPTTPATPSF